MSTSKMEAMALVAEAIRRRVGVTIGDAHIVIALAMCDQIDRRRPRRAAKTIKVLNRSLATRRDRSLAAALPTMYFGSFAAQPVTVMVTSGEYAREDAELYRNIIEEIGAPTRVGVLENEQQAVAAGSAERAEITVATPQALAAVGGHRALIIARVGPAAAKRITSAMPGTAALPDL